MNPKQSWITAPNRFYLKSLFLICIRRKVLFFVLLYYWKNICEEQLSDLFRKVQGIWNIPVIVLWHLFSSKCSTKIHPQGLCWHWPTSQGKNEWNVKIVTKNMRKKKFFSQIFHLMFLEEVKQDLEDKYGSSAQTHDSSLAAWRWWLEKCTWARPLKFTKTSSDLSVVLF